MYNTVPINGTLISNKKDKLLWKKVGEFQKALVAVTENPQLLTMEITDEDF